MISPKLDENIILEGKTVIFKKNDVLKALKVVKGKQLLFEKNKFRCDNIINKEYGQSYKILAGNLILSSMKKKDDKIATAISGADNRCLNDMPGSQNSQSLKQDEIELLKQSGASGDEIVKKIVESSSSFSSKTKFSQNKYLKKKQKKHCELIQLLKPSSRLLCKLYENREPGKVCNMRCDSLSQLLTYSNIRPGSNVVVVDTCAGLLLSSVLEKMSGTGQVVNLHTGGETAPNLTCVQHLNLPDEYWETMHSLPMHMLKKSISEEIPVTELVLQDEDIESIKLKEKEVSVLKRKIPARTENNELLKKENKLSAEDRLNIRIDRRNKRKMHQRKAIELLRSNNIDSLVVASRFHPTPIVMMLMQVLAPSRPFAVYCEYREPLMELFVNLTTSGCAINLQLNETFMRYYQVLEERTHPLVTMPGSRGFVLSGIKVIDT